MDRASVLIADDHCSMLRAVRLVLAPDFEIVGEATDGEQVVQMARDLRPDVIVLDVAMPRQSGIEAARQLSFPAARLRPAIVILTVLEDADVLAAALAAGARAYVLKARMVPDLEPAIRAAMAGRQFVSAGVVAR